MDHTSKINLLSSGCFGPKSDKIGSRIRQNAQPITASSPNPLIHVARQFADDRIIPRFHLEGVDAGRCVSVFRLDPVTGGRRNRIATATAGTGGVDLAEPIVLRAGDGFVAVPEEGT